MLDSAQIARKMPGSFKLCIGKKLRHRIIKCTNKWATIYTPCNTTMKVGKITIAVVPTPKKFLIMLSRPDDPE
jgi:hypothetical protein